MKINLPQSIRKALHSSCRFKVAAIGFNKKGDYLGIATNYPRISRAQGGLHAEINLLRRYGNKVREIVILRVGKTGLLLPIEPCMNCAKVIKKLGIRLYTIDEL